MLLQYLGALENSQSSKTSLIKTATVAEAITVARDKDGDGRQVHILVTGSLHLVGAVLDLKLP